MSSHSQYQTRKNLVKNLKGYFRKPGSKFSDRSLESMTWILNRLKELEKEDESSIYSNSSDLKDVIRLAACRNHSRAIQAILEYFPNLSGKNIRFLKQVGSDETFFKDWLKDGKKFDMDPDASWGDTFLVLNKHFDTQLMNKDSEVSKKEEFNSEIITWMVHDYVYGGGRNNQMELIELFAQNYEFKMSMGQDNDNNHNFLQLMVTHELWDLVENYNIKFDFTEEQFRVALPGIFSHVKTTFEKSRDYVLPLSGIALKIEPLFHEKGIDFKNFVMSYGFSESSENEYRTCVESFQLASFVLWGNPIEDFLNYEFKDSTTFDKCLVKDALPKIYLHEDLKSHLELEEKIIPARKIPSALLEPSRF